MIELIETMTIQPLIIQCSDKEIALLPVPRTKLPELRSLFVELQAIWLGKGFGTGETVADDRAWEIMRAIAAMLPHKDNPAVCGIDLEPLSNDYGLLEQLFLADLAATTPEQLHGWQIVTFDLDNFRGCKILALHSMNPKSVILDADDRRKSEAQQEPKSDTVTALKVA